MTEPATSCLREVQRTLNDFLVGAPFMPLWRAVMDATEHIDSDANVSDQERDWFDELYDLVYMASEDAADAESEELGVTGAEELRREIRELNLESPRPGSA